MISILIPVFNRDVSELAHTLSNQLSTLDINSEIIILDDGSEDRYKKLNAALAVIPHVTYHQLPSNLGRIRIRQRLAEMAKNDWLLFLDCDSKIISERFLKTYRDQLTTNHKVIVGGRVYANLKPTDCSLMLHWKYGREREVSRFGGSYVNRFMTNNFLIAKNVFGTFDFTDGWSGYGYEDTWMAIQLEKNQVAVLFIDNPALHDGVEPASLFITKSKEAIFNLKQLSERTPQYILVKHVRLYNHYLRLKSLRLLFMVTLVYSVLKRSIEKNLHSCNPSLTGFDFYRLNYFVKLMSSVGTGTS